MVKAIRIRKIDIEKIVEKIPRHPKPNIKLEQYVTPSSIVAEILWEALLTGNIVGRKILDLGCGTGRFALIAALLGAKHVTCLDVDVSSLNIAKTYARKLRVDNRVDFVQVWIPQVHVMKVDTIIQNPPFGVWRRHADLIFLSKAFNLKPQTIYSIHKANPESRKIIFNEARKNGYTVKTLSRKRFAIPPFMKHHYKKKHYVLIEIFKFERETEI